MGAWATERSTRLGFLWQSLRFSAGALRPIAAAVALTVAGISTAVFAQVGDAPLGGPRRWEAAMQVGPYGTLNVQTGRVLTTLDVVGWGGKGPAISFSLYHNMTSKWSAPGGTGLTMMGDVNGDDTVTTDDIDPFVDVMLSGDPTEEQLAVCDLDQSQGIGTDDALLLAEKLDRGSPCDPMWTHSYSSHLVFLTGSIKVVADDGTEDVYPQAGGSGNYSSPPGVFNTLQYIDASYPPRYILTTKSQMKAEYSTDGKLRHIYDPSGNTVTCYYITDAHDPAYGKLDYVEDATGRTLDLVYNQYAKLKQVKDALPGADQRTWHLLYEDTLHPGTFSEDGDGYFRVLEDPMEYRIQWDYSACAEIAAISDKNGTPSPSNPVTRYYHSLVYTGGRLTLVRDPAPFTNQTQGFGYYTWQTTNQKTIYTDRRSYPWEFRFNGQSKNLVSTTDPLGHAQSFTYGDVRPPMIHEKTDYTNALNKTWHVTYDLKANVLTSRDPLNHVTTMTYDTLNNLLTVTPPDENGGGNTAKTTHYYYGDEQGHHPTSLTRIEEPQDNGVTPVTTIAYWGTADPPYNPGAWNGLARSVTPPHDITAIPPVNPVVTEYEYDEHGHPTYEREGPPSGRTTPLPVEIWTQYDDIGRPVQSHNALGCGDIVLDGNGNILGMVCCVMFAPPGAANGTSWLPFATCDAPVLPPLFGELQAEPYSPMGEPTTLTNSISDDTAGWVERSTREQTFTFDHLGRMTQHQSTTTEPGWNLVPPAAVARDFSHAEDWTTGTADRWGPDQQQQSHTTTDAAGRVDTFTRGPISAAVAYYNNDAVDTVTYGNGTRVKHVYDDAGRTTTIRHERTDGTPLEVLVYAWSADGSVDSITETDDANNVTTTTFTQDNRNRLTAEVRDGQHPYSMAYYYDIAGNRTRKDDVLNAQETTYVYDVSDPEAYGSQGNRLTSSTLTGPSGVIEDRWYAYDLMGNPNLVVRRIANDEDEQGNQWYRGTRLYYSKDGHLWISRAERWQLDELGQVVEGSCAAYAAMEYRYQGGRARYMVRPRDPETMLPYAAYAAEWFDYDGEAIYGDFALGYHGESGALTPEDVTAHEPGAAQWRHGGPGGSAPPGGEMDLLHYLHGNLIGTTERMTDDPAHGGTTPAAIAHRAVYTAFGERAYECGTANDPCSTGVPPVDARFGYAGAWGYQSGAWDPTPGTCDSGSPSFGCDPIAELGWLHVGARYYDPASGRFAQRDPIGIKGGLNTYAYVENDPTGQVDPDGLIPIVIHWRETRKHRPYSGPLHIVERRGIQQLCANRTVLEAGPFIP